MEMNVKLNYIENIWTDQMIVISMDEIFILKYYWNFQTGEYWNMPNVNKIGETPLVSPSKNNWY